MTKVIVSLSTEKSNKQAALIEYNKLSDDYLDKCADDETSMKQLEDLREVMKEFMKQNGLTPREVRAYRRKLYKGQ